MLIRVRPALLVLGGLLFAGLGTLAFMAGHEIRGALGVLFGGLALARAVALVTRPANKK